MSGGYSVISSALPNDVTVHNRLGIGLLMEGRDQEGLSASEAAVTANPFLRMLGHSGHLR